MPPDRGGFRRVSTNRAASDVSADADPATGVAVYDTYAPTDR
jgi:hypothetical protein